MYLYKAFDTFIQSEIEIPQFIALQDHQADVSFTFGDVRSFLPNDFTDGTAIQNVKGEIGFFWHNVGWYLVRNGNEIIIEPFPNVQEEVLRLPLIGIALAALLQQRRMLVLHASAVSINNMAVVFVGGKGAGKSTTAAMFYKRGHTMISDDVVVVENSENGLPYLVPGFPNFKLMPETATSVLGDDPKNLDEIYTGAEKYYRSSSDNFLEEKVPLKVIYQLEEGKKLRTERLNPQRSISTLIANTYLARYGKILLQNEQATLNLRQCANLINKIPVYRLERPRSFQTLIELAELVESH